MKKFLSLVMALAMTLTLVTVGASAKDFTDKSSINYKEAVDVISAAGIVDGYTDGSFNPSATLTRGAAAKIICNLMLGATAANSLGVASAPFKDVPVTNVFAGYIAYCSSQGIINGYADGTFKPAGTVTGFQFLKMLEGALGYDSAIEVFTGTNWAVNVAKVAVTVGLTKGNSNFVGSKAMTREEACQYALNTLKAETVTYDNKGTSIKTADGTTINMGASTAKKSGVTFMATYQSNLKLSTLGDSMGRPANTWTWKATKIGTYAKTPAVTFTAETKEADVKSALSAYSLPTGMDLTTNDQTPNTNDADTNAKIAAATGNGSVVEVYADSSNVVTNVVKATPVLAQIATINATKKTVTLAPAIGGTAFATITDDDSLYSTLSALSVDDYVMVSYAGAATAGATITAAYVPTTVSGTVSAKNGATATVGGTAYKATATYGTSLSTDLASLGNTSYTLYLDQYGYVAFATATSSTSTNYAYAIGYSKDGTAMTGYTYYLKLVNADGTIAWQKIGQYDGTAITKDSASSNLISNLGSTSLTAGAIVSYSVLTDGSYNVKLASSTPITGATLTQNSTTIGGASFKVSNTTTFLYQNSDDTFSVYTGFTNLPAKTTSSAKVLTNVGNTATYAKLVVVTSGTKSTSSADIMYVMDANFTGNNPDSYVDGAAVYSYDAIVNGALETVYCADNTSYAVGSFYSAVTYAKADYNQLTALGGSAVTAVAAADSGVYYKLNASTDSIIVKDGLLKVTTGANLTEYATADNFAVYYVDTKSTAATSDDALTDVILGSSNLFAGINATTTGAFTTLVTTSEKDGGEATAVYIIANMA